MTVYSCEVWDGPHDLGWVKIGLYSDEGKACAAGTRYIKEHAHGTAHLLDWDHFMADGSKADWYQDDNHGAFTRLIKSIEVDKDLA